MTVRRINYNESLDVTWHELSYTRARLEADADARDLASPLREAMGRLHKVREEQYQRWEEEIAAQAVIDAVDYRLDELIAELASTMDRVVHRDRKSPLWTRYFGSDTPGAVRRLGLASEVRRLAGWVDSLKSQAEPELQELGKQLEQITAEAKQALDGREKAAAARADHRAREIMSLVDDVNALRLSIYGELISRLGKTDKDRRWPDEFFNHRTRPRQTSTELPSGDPATVSPP